MKSLTEFFPECLEKAADKYKIVLVFDSLDQLSVDDSGRLLDWLPRDLPSDVYIVLSTLPGEEYQCLPSLRVRNFTGYMDFFLLSLYISVSSVADFYSFSIHDVYSKERINMVRRILCE